MSLLSPKTVAVIVAHPDDETLWCGGTMLSHPMWKYFIVCLCRSSDQERSEKFYAALKVYGAEGIMGDLDDGPDQRPLVKDEIEDTITGLLPNYHFDLLISHDPHGEYTRHLRHEETGKAVISLWNSGRISANELWTFAYEDGMKAYLPKPLAKAPIYLDLSKDVVTQKYNLITETYGFAPDSFEAMTSPKAEAFRQFLNPEDALKWLESAKASDLESIQS